jgi:hypothetical protein
VSDDLPEGWEAWLAFFSASLPRPVEQTTAPDGSVTFQSGDPGEVIVHLSKHLITISLFSLHWTRSSRQALVVARPIGYVRWRRLLPDDATAAVEALVAAARAARLASFRTCTICERTLPPEWLFDEQTCAECSAVDHGVVH